MRLGDLDVLKENLFIKFGNQLPNGLLDEIDNAPTITPENLIKPIAEVKCEITEEEKQRLIELLRKERPTLVKLEPERPKGEWKYTDTDFNNSVNHYECSLCGRSVSCERFLNVNEYIPFCHCGADMRGDENG